MAEADIERFQNLSKMSSIAIVRYKVSNLPPRIKGVSVSAIYAIVNLKSGNFYIGSSEHVSRRFQAHLSELRRGIHHSAWMQRAWKLRGEDAFEFIILAYCPAEELIKTETELVKTYSPAYNTAVCMDNGMKGRKHTPESIAKMSASKIGKRCGPRAPMSDETKKKLSIAKLGKKLGPMPPMSAEQKASISKNQRLRWSILANNPKTKPVIVDGVRFDCCQYAARALGVSNSEISRRIHSGKIVPA